MKDDDNTITMVAARPLHIVVFPWLAFGHMVPNLELAERFAARGHRVSFVSTPRNISRLRPVAPGLARLVSMVALPFPRLDGLPDGAEATGDVPAGKVDLFHRAFDGLAAPFSAFLEAACAGPDPVDFLMLDSFHYWAAAAAEEHGVPCVLSLIFAATVCRVFGVPRVPRYVYSASESSDKPLPSLDQRFVLTLEKCRFVICRSSFEMEPEPLPLLPGIFGKPVIPYGLVPPSAAPIGGRREGDDATLRWLDGGGGGHPPRSVVFVALGSEPPVTLEQLHELALGLELAGARFLWALKRPNAVPVSVSDALLLPPGFQDRTRGRGLVAVGWVPQPRVLAHAAVGAFVTHCGWSSILEALQFGKPLVLLPFLREQRLNARLVESKQAGVQVPRFGEDDQSFGREGVAKAIRAVLSSDGDEQGGGGTGSVLAANAEKLQKIVADTKSQERYIDELLGFMRTQIKD